MEKNKDYSFLKVVGLISVILFHSCRMYKQNWHFESVVQNNFFKNLATYLGTFQMPLFVFVSGAIYYLCRKQLGKYASFNNILYKKCTRLLLPYLVLGCLYIIPTRKLLGFYVGENYFKLILSNIILSRGVDAGHLWYVLMLFNLFLVFYVLEKYINKIPVKINLIILLGLNIISFKIPTIFQIGNVVKYMLPFYLGYLFQENKEYLLAIVNKKYIGTILFILHFLIFKINTIIPEGILFVIIGNLLNVILFILGIGFIYGLYIWIQEKHETILNNKIFKILDKYNFAIYLINEPILLFMLKPLKDMYINPIIIVSACFSTSMIVSIILAILISKLKYVKKIFGM